MKNTETDLTLEEIRAAQAEIAGEMDNSQLPQVAQRSLEKASLHLRNLERLLVDAIEATLIKDLKNETSSLKGLVEEMNKTAGELFRITKILDNVVRITGQLIEVLGKVVKVT
jgi:hypothetical protein